MNLGNLGNLQQIPQNYVGLMFKYIMHTSRSFAHIHENNMCHGNYNLSKVIAQRKSQGLEIEAINFHIINMEPWRVYQMLRKQL